MSGFADRVRLATEYADAGSQVCQIHTAQEHAPDEWGYDGGNNHHGAVVVKGAARDHLVLSDGSRIYLDGQVLTVAEFAAQEASQ